MKRTWHKLRKDEKGQVLIMALVVMLLGGLIIAPLLDHMGTGLKIEKEVYEKRMSLLYAADSGVEDALWKIQGKVTGLPAVGQAPWQYGIGTVNGNTTTVTIARIDDATFKINSLATSDSSRNTTIESYIRVLDLSLDMSNAITSKADVTIQPNTSVIGDVCLNGTLDNKGYISGAVKRDPITTWQWPTDDLISRFYFRDVRGLTPFSGDSIDLKSTTTIGPLYRAGNLTIDNTGSQTTVMLGGTVYVTGNLTFAQPGTKNAYTINLDGQTIFVEGSVNFAPQRVTLSGSGCIIALGDIDFLPALQSTPADFVFVMSVNSTVTFQPSGGFYGSVAGDIMVNVQPGVSLGWSGPHPTLNVPDFKGNAIAEIVTWTITP